MTPSFLLAVPLRQRIVQQSQKHIDRIEHDSSGSPRVGLGLDSSQHSTQVKFAGLDHVRPPLSIKNHKPLFLDELRNRSIKRINEDPVFHDLSAEIQLIKWPRRLLASVPSTQAHRSILVGAYHEALQQRRRDQQSEEFRLQMHQRNAIEGTISELVRSHGLRRARYKGFAKADLQNQLIAAACNIKRWSESSSEPLLRVKKKISG